MKKIVTLLTVAVMLLTFSVQALAVQFVPSIEYKGAPAVVTRMEDGKEIIGKIVDANGNVLSIEEPGCIIVTPVGEVYEKKADTGALTLLNPISFGFALKAEAAEEHQVTEEVKNDLIGAYDELKEKGTDVFGGQVEKDMVVRDLFAVSTECENILDLLPVNGNTLDLTFDLNLDAKAPVAAMLCVNDQWKKMPVVNNGDGTVTATFEDLGVVAFLTETTADGPDTGDDSAKDMALWISLMVVSAGAIVALLVVARRKKAEK